MTHKTAKYTVVYEEYERGWGSRVDETREFETEEEALKEIKRYNDEYNTEEKAPDWYIVAKKGWK